MKDLFHEAMRIVQNRKRKFPTFRPHGIYLTKTDYILATSYMPQIRTKIERAGHVSREEWLVNARNYIFSQLALGLHSSKINNLKGDEYGTKI